MVRHPQSRQGLSLFGVGGRNPFCLLPELAGFILAAETAIQEPQVVASRDIVGITGQGLAKAGLSFLPALFLIIRKT